MYCIYIRGYLYGGKKGGTKEKKKNNINGFMTMATKTDFRTPSISYRQTQVALKCIYSLDSYRGIKYKIRRTIYNKGKRKIKNNNNK